MNDINECSMQMNDIHPNRRTGIFRLRFSNEFYRKMFLMILIYTLLSFEAIATEQHDYSKQVSVPLFGASSCRNTTTPSLIACVSLAAASGSVSFFYNSYEDVCRWNCFFLGSRSCTTYCTAPWSYYGM